MKIFFVSPEAAPFAAIGGLGEVVGSLPKYLKKLGHDVRVVIPLYGCIKDREEFIGHETPLVVWIGHEKRLCKIWESKLPASEVPIYFIEYNLFYGRQEIYDAPWGGFQDNDHRFAFLNRAAIDLCNYLNWIPDVFHCHDWTTGLLPVYLNTHDRGTPIAAAATVLTIHNMQFQGIFYSGLIEWAHLDRNEVFRSDNLESAGGVNMLKGGIYNATKVSAVSSGYAEEIRTREGGCGLESVLCYKAADLVGILNGIDTEVWNPATDKMITSNFSAEDLSGKARCKAELQKAFNLTPDPDVPVFAVVGRLTYQKGLDLLTSIIPKLMAEMKLQIVVIGRGDQTLQWSFSTLAEKYPGRMAAIVGRDSERFHLAFAGSDALLMPSRFEPCGLSQLYAMRYGTLPLARATGGLADTIEQYQEGSARGTGFLFELPTAEALYHTIIWACETYRQRPQDWSKLRENAMRKDFDWSASAKKYEELYGWAVEQRTGTKPIIT